MDGVTQITYEQRRTAIGDAVLHYLEKEGGWIHRDRLIEAAGLRFTRFDLMGPIVAFENALLDLNKRLVKRRQVVSRKESAGRIQELYRLERRPS